MNSDQGSKSDRWKSLPDQKSELPLEPENSESWISEIFDVRVIMFLICVTVIAMTATVLLLRDKVETPNPEVADLKSAPIESSGPKADSTGVPVENNGQHLTVRQKADGGFTLPLSSATIEKCKRTSTGISEWQPAGVAKWRLKFDDRRSGFFYCNVTYQTTSECQFGLQMGDRSARNFTLYPQDGDFTEQFIIRLDKPDTQTVQLIAIGQEASQAVIRKITLVSQK